MVALRGPTSSNFEHLNSCLKYINQATEDYIYNLGYELVGGAIRS